MATPTVQIKSALWYKTEISGNFPMAAKYKADSTSKRDGFIWIEAGFGNDGKVKKTRVAINEGDFEVIGAPSAVKAKAMSDDDIEKEITDRFEVMELLTEGVINHSIKALIVSGAAGIGKTYTIDKMLNEAYKSEKISKYSMIGGSCTAIGLYMTLYAHQNKGNVLVLDDIDSIFDDQEALNLLKGALDTGRTRQISWLGDSKVLRREEIENTFEFNGTIIFITNHNFDDRIAKGGKMAVHYEALISRCMYLDLGIHSMREVLVRIRQVIRKTDMMRKLGMSEAETIQAMDWLMANVNELRKVDLRTMIKLSQAMKASRRGWTKIAKAALCRR